MTFHGNRRWLHHLLRSHSWQGSLRGGLVTPGKGGAGRTTIRALIRPARGGSAHGRGRSTATMRAPETALDQEMTFVTTTEAEMRGTILIRQLIGNAPGMNAAKKIGGSQNPDREKGQRNLTGPAGPGRWGGAVLLQTQHG